MSNTQNTLRDMLEQTINASENGTLGKAQDAPAIESKAPEAQQTPQAEAAQEAAQAQAAQRARDEAGRFKAKESETGQEDVQPMAQQQSQEVAPTPAPPPAESADLQGPTTWRKEYKPLWDKIASGQPLTAEESKKLASYSVQREREFATGVSLYRGQAMAAKELTDAMTPFASILAQHNIKASDWITNLGNAHKALAFGSPEQKLQIFQKLAGDYGVPLAAIQQSANGSQIDPVVPQLMQHIQNLENKYNELYGWKNQQQQVSVEQELAKFMDASKYPYFEQVRDEMAQLLESGYAKDLDTAYAKAVRLNDEAWNAELERQAQAQQQTLANQSSAAAVAKAKSAAVSPRSVAPSGATSAIDPKDRHAMLAAAFNDRTAGGRV